MMESAEGNPALVAFCGLIILQPNLSMVIALTFMTMIMLVAGNVRKLHIAMVAAAAVGLVVLLIIIEPYRFARYQIFTDPWQDPTKNGYQLIQSLYALASGGIFGRGLGRSMQKNLFLPYGHRSPGPPLLLATKALPWSSFTR